MNEPSFEDFSNLPVWLPKKLNDAGMSPEQFAGRLNVSRTMIYDYISDASRPSEQAALRMSRILGVTFEELLSQYTPKENGRPSEKNRNMRLLQAQEAMRERIQTAARLKAARLQLGESAGNGGIGRPRDGGVKLGEPAVPRAQETVNIPAQVPVESRDRWNVKRKNQMSQVSMEANGRFGQMFAAAVSRERLSLRDLAAQLEYTYEQMRKVWTGTSSPSPLLLKEICRFLHMDFDKAKEAATADRMERKYGSTAYRVIGKNPRFADIEDVIPQLSDTEWGMFVAQIRGFIHQKRMG